MSLVRKFKHVPLVRNVGHKEADATYSIVEMPSGELQLQIDTYGSSDRVDKTPGHRAQSIRLSSEAMQQLKKILAGIA